MVLRALVVVAVATAVAVGADRGESPAVAPDADRVLADAAQTVVVTLLVWALLVAIAGELRAARGPLGDLADLTWRLLVPAALRVALPAAVGVHSVVAAGPAGAAGPGATAPAVVASAPVPALGLGVFPRPGAAAEAGVVAGSGVPEVRRPDTSAPDPAPRLPNSPPRPPDSPPRPPDSPPPTPPVPAQPQSPGAVVVTPGDSLWRIAERHLGGEPSNAAIATEWPRWYAANRATIGPDPDLILVGQVLAAPPSPPPPPPSGTGP